MEQKNITVSHINIRLSISLLMLKLLFIEVLASAVVILFHTLFFTYDGGSLSRFGFNFQLFNVPVFVILAVIKAFVVFYVIMQWVSEYYEITLDTVYHRRGVIFKREEKFPLEHIEFVEVFQSLLGRIFNFGTISLFDRRRNKYEDVYLIHNPLRYAKVIEALLPKADETKRILREHIIEPESHEDDAPFLRPITFYPQSFR